MRPNRRVSSPGSFHVRSSRAPSDSTIVSEEGKSIFDGDHLDEQSESAESEIDVEASLETLAWRTGVLGRAGKDYSDDDDSLELNGSNRKGKGMKSLSIDVQRVSPISLTFQHLLQPG